MSLSRSISNADDTEGLIRDSTKQKKQRKMLQRQSNSQMLNNNNKNICNNKNNKTTLWKSEMRQKVYSTKLLKALSQFRLGSARLHGQAVHEAADRVLAMTAKGQSRWSRAILKNKLKCKFMKCKPRKKETNGNARLKKPSILKSKWKKNISAVAKKGRDLGRIVPGCKKQALPVVLEEATDYIAALEMQVKAMAALADLFTGGYNSGFGNGAVDLSRLGISQTSTS